MTDPQLNYRAGLDELKEIHSRLCNDDVDVDRLYQDVKRAADLLTFCRDAPLGGERLEEVLTDFETED